MTHIKLQKAKLEDLDTILQEKAIAICMKN